MYELIRAGARTYYMDCPSKVGLVLLADKDVLLIDSGSDKNAAKKVLRHCEENGWTVSAILCTHSHADHIGGCRTIQEKTGCLVYASGIEAAFTRDPILEPAFLYGGCPPRALRGKFLMAAACEASLFPDPLPGGLTAVPLPGHSFEMIGFRTSDDVVFLADSLAGETALEKYPIAYLYDVRAYLESLDAVERMQAALFVPSHAPAVPDIRPLVSVNRAKLADNLRILASFCVQPKSFEELLKAFFDRNAHGLDMTQAALAGSTIRSYLAYLEEEGILEPIIAENRLLWKAVNPDAVDAGSPDR